MNIYGLSSKSPGLIPDCNALATERARLSVLAGWSATTSEDAGVGPFPSNDPVFQALNQSITSTSTPYRKERKPKRPLTSYNFFFKQAQKKIPRGRGGKHGKPRTEGQAQLISQQWKKTTKEERRYFEELASLDKLRYEKQMKEWKAYMDTVIDAMIGEDCNTDEARDQTIRHMPVMYGNVSRSGSVASSSEEGDHCDLGMDSFNFAGRSTQPHNVPSACSQSIAEVPTTKTTPHLKTSDCAPLILPPTQCQRQTIPELAAKLGDEGVDLVIRTCLRL